MAGKRKSSHLVLIIIIMGCVWACSYNQDCFKDYAEIRFIVSPSVIVDCRSLMPDESQISNVDIFIFDEYGKLEVRISKEGNDEAIRLLKDRDYSIYACANIDISSDIRHEDEMKGIIHRIDAPDDYNHGLPMSCLKSIHLSKDTSICLKMERLVSKISICMDRSLLSDCVLTDVRKISIGNCPKVVTPFQESRISCSDEFFVSGFCIDDTDRLNTSDTNGRSGEISMYLLENIQRNSSDNNNLDSLCSYVEIEVNYLSDSLYCTDTPMKYRFYIGDGNGRHSVERNCHYHITVCPEDDGISEDSWKTDRTGLHTFVKEILLTDDKISFSYDGESHLIGAEVLPKHAYMKELSWRSTDENIAIVDKTGRVTATGEGSCMIICSALDGGNAISSCYLVSEFAPPYFRAYPEERYINGNIGDTVRLWCEIFPPDTPFDIGIDYLEDDKADGIYDYQVDEDGHGVTLVLTGSGSGLIYMEASEPVNDAALFFIEVNLDST